jgi:hypothetical protein
LEFSNPCPKRRLVAFAVESFISGRIVDILLKNISAQQDLYFVDFRITRAGSRARKHFVSLDGMVRKLVSRR